MDLRPIKNKVLVKLDDPEAMKGSLLLSEFYQKRNLHATVIAVGKKVKEVKVGDRVYIDPDGQAMKAQKIDQPDGMYLVVEPEIILGVFE